jgi:uncharacterized protein (DUF2252 family)
VRNLDPQGLAHRQIEIDGARTCAFPELLERKRRRMCASPLAFLRGSAPLFYEMLRERGELDDGPAGTGYVVGDAHLENFGAYTPRRVGGEANERRRACFDLNDFDEAAVGPFHWDVSRLSASLILGSRELGVDGPHVLELCRALIRGYVAAFSQGPLPSSPRPVARLIEQVQNRSRKDLLDARTDALAEGRHFQLGPRYLALPSGYRPELPGALASYVQSLEPNERPRPGQLEVVDAAFRVAGTGSLGALRIAVLVVGKGGTDGEFLFDLKEQLPNSAARALKGKAVADAEAVVSAWRNCLVEPPRQLGSASLRTPDGQIKRLVVRRLTPQEDKLELATLDRSDLPGLATYLGSLLGRAHARGAVALGRPLPAPWSEGEQAALLARAVSLAGLHEAAYLAYCLLSGGS